MSIILSSIKNTTENTDDGESSGVQFLETKTSGIFDHAGGQLRLESFDVTVAIPEGAMEKGTSQEVVFELLPKVPAYFQLQENEMTITFGFKCSTSNVTFLKPLKMTMPHCAILGGPFETNVIIYKGNSTTHGN